MMKTTFAASMLTILLLVFTFNILSEPITYEGSIEGLVFLFDPEPLPLKLPGIDTTVTFAQVEAEGREHIVITPSGRYNYSAKLESGTIYVWENVIVTTDDQGNITGVEPDGDPIVIAMESASSNEHFDIEGPIPDNPHEVEVPDDVDLYFKATLTTDDGTVKYQLKIKNGQVQFIRPWL
ncbi:hypothetical protein ACFL6S_25860 [Candidatus Poribacteria bacterium]